MSRRKAVHGGLAAVATALAALTAAPAAFAATPSTWSGQSTSPNWSNAGNWSDNVPGGSTSALTFGDLATCDTGASGGAVCYGTANSPLIDNVAGVSANTLTINGGQEYQVAPNDPSTDTVTLTPATSGGIGLTAAPTNTSCITPSVPCTLNLADWGVPIILGSDQEWDVSGYGNLYLNTISGAHALNLNLNNGYVQANDIETSSVTVSGAGDLQLDQAAGSAEKLPNVTVSDGTGPNPTESALTVAAANASSGNITINGTNNNFIVLTDRAPGETVLTANGNVALDSTTNVEFDIDGNNTTASTDSSQLVTTTGHTVNFGGAKISLWQARNAGNCDTLATGKTFTIVQGAGTLSGQISIGGKLISPGQSATETFQSNSADCPASAAKTTAVVDYTANSITATIAGAPVADTAHAPQITGGTTAGDKLTVTSNGTWTAYPAPAYSYQWYACSGSSCSSISGATGSSYTLTNAEAGKTVKVKVTASNSQGSASAFSNTLGPVIATTSGGGGSSLRALIRADLARLGHPHGHHAILLMIRKGYYRTHFRAQVAGTLSDSWTTTVRTGHGRHARRHTFVIAGATVHVRANHTTTITIHLTRIGRSLLHRHPFSVLTTAHERYRVSGLGWTSITRKFWL